MKKSQLPTEGAKQGFDPRRVVEGDIYAAMHWLVFCAFRHWSRAWTGLTSCLAPNPSSALRISRREKSASICRFHCLPTCIAFCFSYSSAAAVGAGIGQHQELLPAGPAAANFQQRQIVLGPQHFPNRAEAGEGLRIRTGLFDVFSQYRYPTPSGKS